MWDVGCREQVARRWGGYGGRGELDDAPERLEQPGREARGVPAYLPRQATI